MVVLMEMGEEKRMGRVRERRRGATSGGYSLREKRIRTGERRGNDDGD